MLRALARTIAALALLAELVAVPVGDRVSAPSNQAQADIRQAVP